MNPVKELTAKQEAFVLAFFETNNAAEAYRRAYDVAPDARDAWIYVEACQLLDHPKVAIRLSALREQAARLSIYTVGKALEEYEAVRQLAETEKNPSAAVSAINGKVKLLGLDQPRKVTLSGKLEQADNSAAAILAARLDAIEERAKSAVAG